MNSNAVTVLPDEQARFALRAFIQRAETRLSTMHGIAGAFIGGAGLLVLLPVLYRDYAADLIVQIANAIWNKGSRLPFIFWYWNEWTSSIFWDWATAFWIFPFIFSLLIPSYAIYLLIRELVLFYFVPHGYSQSEMKYFFPRFALSAISFPVDDGVIAVGGDAGYAPGTYSKVKLAIIRAWYLPETMHYVFPKNPNVRERKDLDKIYSKNRSFVAALAPSPQRISIRNTLAPELKTDAAQYDLRGTMAGLSDRTLIEEAARLEGTLTRLNYHLRVIVLRYMKALVAFIWTLIIIAFAMTLASYAADRLAASDPPASLLVRSLFGDLIFLTTGLVWATATPFVVSAPINWIRKYRDLHSYRGEFRRDSGLITFERWVYGFCLAGTVFSSLGLCAIVFWEGPIIGIDSGYEKVTYAVLILASFYIVLFPKFRWL